MFSTSEIIINYGKSFKDTGSIIVQIAILTFKVKYLQKHLNKYKKDYQAKRSLMCIISYRKKLLNYLKKKKNKQYIFILKKLNLRH